MVLPPSSRISLHQSPLAKAQGFALAKTFFLELGKAPARAKRFADAKSIFQSGQGSALSSLLEHYPWGTIGGGKIVDVGGWHGTRSIAIAEISPSLHCVVLDLPEVVADGPSKILSDLQTRVTIAAHGFFQEPPEVAKGADVYLFCRIFHNGRIQQLQGKPISNVSASSRRSFSRGVIRYLAAGALVCAAVGVNPPHLLSSDVPLGHDRHVIGTFEESKDKMLEVLKMLLPGLNKVRCWSGPTNAQAPQANFAFLAQLHERQQPKEWSKVPIPGVSLDATGLIFLADLTTIAKHTALNGTSSFLDLFVLCPGIHRQRYATELNGGELPPTAALTSGYVFRIENQATVFYLQKMGVSGHLVTLRVEELKPGGRMPEPKDVRKAATLASLLYITPVPLTLTALAFVILLEDWWALAVLLILVLARTLNAIVVKRRSVPGWKGVKEPGVKGDLLVLLSQDRWIRLQGPVDALKAVTAGQWLRDTTFWEGSLTAIATLLVYINAALTTNASQAGEITILALLLLSVGLVATSNELQESLYMHGCRIHVDGEPKKYARRLDLANELIKYTGREDWAIRLGMINQKSDDTDTVKVVL